MQDVSSLMIGARRISIYSPVGLRHICFAVLMALLACPRATAAETVTRVSFKNPSGATQNIDGRILVDALDQSFLLLGRDGRMWSVFPDQLVDRKSTDEPFEPLAREELGKQLLEEFGRGFEITNTKHYVICSNTDKRYAKWCGTLFERLMTAFRSQWRNSKVEMREPDMPLVAVIFADRRGFAEYAMRDHGPETANALGYYSIRTNRIALYDLTTEVSGARSGDVATQLEASLSNVATVVHEATHQMAFNCGMHTRYAENPLWLVEGMAMYFETPDVRSSSGWKTLGRINPARMRNFADAVTRGRPADSLEKLVSTDKRLTDPETAGQAYAEAWALTYFLIKTKRKEYTEYLQRLAKKKPLVFGEPQDRLAEFRAAFGDDLQKLDREFVRYMSRQ